MAEGNGRQKTLYDTLRLDQEKVKRLSDTHGATSEEVYRLIRSAYLTEVRKYRGVLTSTRRSTNTLKLAEVNDAYRVLRNPESRERYDSRLLEEIVNRSGTEQSQPTHSDNHRAADASRHDGAGPSPGNYGEERSSERSSPPPSNSWMNERNIGIMNIVGFICLLLSTSYGKSPPWRIQQDTCRYETLNDAIRSALHVKDNKGETVSIYWDGRKSIVYRFRFDNGSAEILGQDRARFIQLWGIVDSHCQNYIDSLTIVDSNTKRNEPLNLERAIAVAGVLSEIVPISLKKDYYSHQGHSGTYVAIDLNLAKK